MQCVTLRHMALECQSIKQSELVQDEMVPSRIGSSNVPC
jgi:hypothetical protein